jgi:hypothetical protein
MIKPGIALLLLVSFAGCGRQAELQDVYDPAALSPVSMVELIANPRMFHGHRVSTAGFLNLAFEGNALYLSREHKEAFIPQNALWFDFPAEMANDLARFNGSYVSVLALFTHDPKGDGHLGQYSGNVRIDSLNDIRRTGGPP